nr:MAG TPA: hypothetical protein [Caudoviricetes sp.]
MFFVYNKINIKFCILYTIFYIMYYVFCLKNIVYNIMHYVYYILFNVYCIQYIYILFIISSKIIFLFYFFIVAV